MSSFEYPYYAAILSAVLALVLGVAWYHPRCQGTRWLLARGMKPEDASKPSEVSLVLSFLLWLLAACFYGFLAAFLELSSLPALISLSCLLWVAFSMPPILMGSIYTGYPFQAAAIDAAYHLSGYYIFALCFAILGSHVISTPVPTHQ